MIVEYQLDQVLVGVAFTLLIQLALVGLKTKYGNKKKGK
jgi:hypothetical protein